MQIYTSGTTLKTKSVGSHGPICVIRNLYYQVPLKYKMDALRTQKYLKSKPHEFILSVFANQEAYASLLIFSTFP